MKKRILIIDNDKQLNRINEKVLHAAGIVKDLKILSNGKDALDYLTASVAGGDPLPEIIILDLYMPVMDGFQLIDELKRLGFPEKYNAEIVVFTYSNSAKDRQKSYSKGVKHYLSKPYILRGLIDIINKLKPSQGDKYSVAKSIGWEKSIS